MLGAAVALFVASRAASDALASRDAKRPGLRALGYWMPIAATALAAALMNAPQVAVAVIFATSLGCLSLVFGVITYVSPPAEPMAPPRAWGFVLPTALLALVAGFGGQFTGVHAILLLLMGGAFLSVWLDQPGDLEGVLDHYSSDAAAADSELQRRVIQVVLAVALAAIGGIAGVLGMNISSHAGPALPPTALAATVLSPLLTLPILGPGAMLAQRGHASSIGSTLIGIVLLNLCALLPLVIIVWYVRVIGLHPGGFGNIVRGLREAGLPYAITVWRVDTVILTVLGFAAIPVGLGRWALGRLEALGLIIGYVAYLFVTVTMAWR